jgi:hypothetical protein
MGLKRPGRAILPLSHTSSSHSTLLIMHRDNFTLPYLTYAPYADVSLFDAPLRVLTIKVHSYFLFLPLEHK